MNKVVTEHIDIFFAKLKGQSKSIALCHGVFDLLHPGHFDHFASAKELADILIVSVTADEFVNKGPNRPAFDLETRIRSISQLSAVTYVVPSFNETAEYILSQIKPDFYVKGSEYAEFENDVTGNIKRETSIVEAYGGKVVYTEGFTSSSSKLINQYFLAKDSEEYKLLKDIRDNLKYSEIRKFFGDVSKLKVAVVGEIIVDRYTSCSPLGKSSKDPILAFQEHQTHSYPGGVLSMANNISDFVDEVKVFSHQSSIGSLSFDFQISEKIEFFNIYDDGKPDIVKHRFIDHGSRVKLFEKYTFNPNQLLWSNVSNYWNQVCSELEKFDIVIIADYGHGFISRQEIEEISKSKINFLSVNTQANAGNRGFNTIAKYNRADLICLNGQELQLELRDSNPDYLKIVPSYIREMNARWAILTLGAEGLLIFDSAGNHVKIPALADRVIDRVGAGDAVLALGSLFAGIGAPPQLVGLIASLAASSEVAQLGHRHGILQTELLKSLKALLA
jgi:rfaE bifunctional protein nucleotidyltransferase chain/domain